MRLAQLYAGMTDGELQKVASEAASLTDVARQALGFEVERRGIHIDIDDTPPSVETVEFRRLVTVAQFRDLPEALMAKGALESVGIEAFLNDENLVRMDWFYSNAIGGMRLQVKPEDAEAAESVLNGPVPQSFQVEEVGEYEQPRCPKCGSDEVTTLGADEENLAIWRLQARGISIPRERDVWRCSACGHEWLTE